MVQHSKVKTVSQKKAAELAEKLTNQGTVEPRSLRTRPEDYERIKREKRLAEYSVRLSSPDRTVDGSQSFSSLDAMKGVGRSPHRARSPNGRRKSARSPQLQRFLERQQEAIDLQRANLLQKKARLLEEEKAMMNSSKLAQTVGKSDRQRALKLRSPPRSVTTPRQGYSRSPMRDTGGGSPTRSQASPKVAVVGEVVTSAGVTESGVTVPVVKARIRQADPDELSPRGAAVGGSPRVVTVESVSSWSSGPVPEEEDEGRDAGIAAAAAGHSPGRVSREVQDSVEARVAAAVASAAATSPAAVDKGYALPGREERNALFDRFDANGNGGLSLAEIDKAVVELWPHFDHKRALMRAYKAADTSGDGLIKRREFRLLLKYIVYFNDLWDTFEALDTNDDHRLTQSEFREGVSALKMKLGAEEVAAAFETMDADGGGYVLFDEFCGWCAKAMVSAEVEEVEAQVAAAVEAEEAAQAAAQSVGKAGDASDTLTAVAAVVEAEILADDGLIRSPMAATLPATATVAPAGNGNGSGESDPITLNDDDEFVSVVCPEGLQPGDMIVISHPDTGEDVEGEVPEGVSPGDEFEVFIG
jgi:Ca2+-binding EF-hand superfamily protein